MYRGVETLWYTGPMSTVSPVRRDPHSDAAFIAAKKSRNPERVVEMLTLHPGLSVWQMVEVFHLGPHQSISSAVNGLAKKGIIYAQGETETPRGAKACRWYVYTGDLGL